MFNLCRHGQVVSRKSISLIPRALILPTSECTFMQEYILKKKDPIYRSHLITPPSPLARRLATHARGMDHSSRVLCQHRTLKKIQQLSEIPRNTVNIKVIKHWKCENSARHPPLPLLAINVNRPYNNYSMSPSWIWSDKISNERVARVGYNHFISNKGEWNNCFSKLKTKN